MNKFIAATIPQNFSDLTTLATGNPHRVGIGVCGQSASKLLPIVRSDNHGIAARKATPDTDNTRRQQALSLFERALRPRVDNDLADGIEGADDPSLPRGQG